MAQKWVPYKTTCGYWSETCPDGDVQHLKEHVIPGHWVKVPAPIVRLQQP